MEPAVGGESFAGEGASVRPGGKTKVVILGEEAARYFKGCERQDVLERELGYCSGCGKAAYTS